LASLTQAFFLAVQSLSGSHVSPPSTVPLPQTAPQSASLLAVQPEGQQLSAVSEQAVIATDVHFTLHVLAAPVRVTFMHSAVGHVAGQPAPSQVSPSEVSTLPLPQPAQSLSVAGPQPVGQNVSLATQPRDDSTHANVHFVASPVSLRTVLTSLTHADFFCWHDVSGSQVSPASTLPLPQPTQSVSVVGPQAVGQNPSPSTQLRAVTAHENVHFAGSPDCVRIMLASLTQAVFFVVQSLTGSHVSPGSTLLLPHTARQSMSSVAEQSAAPPVPVGQQLSETSEHVVMGSATHFALQAAAVPVIVT
jgi:hypothetical protein